MNVTSVPGEPDETSERGRLLTPGNDDGMMAERSGEAHRKTAVLQERCHGWVVISDGTAASQTAATAS